MSVKSPHHDRVEFEPPPYGWGFIFQMVLLAFSMFGLQIGLMSLMPENWWSNGQIQGPGMRGPLGRQSALTILPGSSVVWQGELWVSVAAGPPPMMGSSGSRPQSTRLIAIDLKTGTPRETNITLSPSPAGLVVVSNELWCVAETVVYRIHGGEAIPRHPRRSLIQPSKPFVHEGHLAIVDKNRNDRSKLLIWLEGEWIDEGEVDLPTLPVPSPWFAPELRIVSNNNSTFVFHSNGQSVSYRMGIDPISDSKPISALEPENDRVPLPGLGTAVLAGVQIALPGWKTTPIPIQWANSWEVASIHDELHAFALASPNNFSRIEQFKLQKGNWVKTTPKFPPEVLSFGIAGGSPGYLVTDDLRLFSLDGSTFERVTTGIPMTERFRFVLMRLGWMGIYVLPIMVLTLIASWLMRRHRTPLYLYGKRTVIQASLVRRGIARGVDVLVCVFPAMFWFSLALDAEIQQLLEQQTASIGFKHSFLVLLLLIFGMWLGILLTISFMEGCWGFTPGKWICGIRTMRTTLRPCGMLRAFARELLVYGDSVFLLTWLPGVLLIAFTPNWQRLGDLVADTVVIMNPKR